MLQRLNQLIIRTSLSGWLFIATTLVFAASLAALLRIGKVFPAYAAGAQPLDLQNELAPEQVFTQIAGYSAQARELYYLFTAIDYVFPLAAGLFLGAAGAFALRHGLPQIYGFMVEHRLLPLFLLASAFDWCENIAAISAILVYPDTPGLLATLLVAAKRAKVFSIMVTQPLVALLLLIAAARWIGRRLRPA